MKYQLIQAFNMKQALIRIHEEFGGDAMICRTRNSVGGIEVLVAIPDENDTKVIDAVSQFNISSEYAKSRLLNEKTVIEQPIAHQAVHKRAGKFNKIKHGIKRVFSYRKKLKMIRKLMAKPMNELGNVATRFKMKLHNHLHSRTINAFVGPSGVGKTTTLIKIAVQYSMNYQPSDIGIISNNIDDLYLNNKLNQFCRLYQIDFEHVNTTDGLNDALDRMQDKKIILIDTHGISHRDVPSIHNQRHILEKAAQPISVYLVIPASHQPAVIEDALQFYTFKHMEGCILTKADEALSLSPALSVLDKCDLPVVYICNGEDLENDIYSVKSDDSLVHFSLEKYVNLNIPAYSAQSAY